MSFWTHVNGVVYGTTYVTKRELQKSFKVVHYSDEDSVWDACNVPCGSEGSLDVSIHEGEDHLMHISFFGNLRGFEEYEHPNIIEWVKKFIREHNIWVRSGLININSDIYYHSYSEKELDAYYTEEDTEFPVGEFKRALTGFDQV